MEFTITFIELFCLGIYFCLPLMIFLGLLIALMGQIAGGIERWSRFDALYWSCITALTVGYGDIRPMGRKAKVLAVLIALVGMMFTGIFVAITVQAASRAFTKHIDPSILANLGVP
ncbi:MAG: two pore domain potassium channel family protein [Hahellaceae bacterium]|nr:two pore domain potassium channel family protein [Hahellaceae bacterium]